MTKKIRTFLFLAFLVFFLLAAPLAIFYSQGYRFDWEAKKITQTGGLFLKIYPKQVEVYLDGKLKKKTDFFFGSVLIENLLPKKYRVEIKKEGYLPWQKNLEVKEKEVVEAKNIILFPQKPNLTILTKGVKNLWLSPNKSELILKEYEEKNWALKLYDLEKDVKSHLINEGDIYPGGADLLNLEFVKENPQELFLEIGTREQLKYFTLEIDRTPPALKETEAPSPPLKDVIIYQVTNGELYYLDNLGNLFKNEEKLTEEPFSIRSETDYALEIFQDTIFLREEQTLYRFNSESKSFEKFFEEVKELRISPDNKKLVYFSNYEILVLFLEDVFEQPQKKAGEKILIARLSKKIENCFWFNSDYLIFNSGDVIKIAELDDRDQINIIDLAEIKNPETFWNNLNKRLYILSNENLYVSAPLF